MKTIEKKYWCNGLDSRGNYFYTLSGSILNFAFMVSFSREDKILKSYIGLSFYKLVK